MSFVEFFSIKPGEERTIPLRILQKDRTSFDLTGVTEIQVRFRRKDGQALVKTLVNISPLLGGVSITEALEGRIQVVLNPEDSILLKQAERQDFTAIAYKGNWSQFSDSGVTVRSKVPGSLLNGTQLVFDGVKTVDQVVAEYNDSVNIDYEVMVSAGSGLSVLTVGPRTLALGSNTGKRIANFKRAITVEKQSV